jgi:predicted ATP-dependent protease
MASRAEGWERDGTGPVAPLPADRLARRCDPASLGFGTTAELADVTEIIGQARAVEAIDFAMQMPGQGYNLLVMGPEGSGKYTAIRQYLTQQAACRPVPDDWCYVHNFEDPRRPRAIRLPAGRGRQLRATMAGLVRELAVAMPAALENEEYRNRRLALEEAFKSRRDGAFAALGEKAMGRGVALARTPVGFGVAPLRGQEVIQPEEFARLPAAEQERMRAAMSAVETELQGLLATIPTWERDHRREVRDLNQETVRRAVDQLIVEVREGFADMPAVGRFLDNVEADVVERAEEYLTMHGQAERGEGALVPAGDGTGAFSRCVVNLVVDNAELTCAPVVHEDLPTYPNLHGQVEQVAHLGALVTDFTLIKAGALHRANGGYLVLDVRRLLQQPYAWEELKRALRSRELRVDRVPAAATWLATASIEPEPIPLDIKVVLLGDRSLFHLVAALDPDVGELFRIRADFDDRSRRTAETERVYASLLATIARREGLHPLDAAAAAAVIDQAAREADHSERLTTNLRALTDLVRESDRIATVAGAGCIGREHVDAAIDARRRRASRLAEELRTATVEGIVRVETSGSMASQVNGLSIASGGDELFGWPTRITAQVRLGRGDVVDIEREVALGGPIHSKGVLILAGFLGGRFGRHKPLALQASLVFEQSYVAVEGDSASLAELCALLSSIADVPIRQSLAVTGSVDQLGRSQAIGGVNQKIEGFFDLCAASGLTGEQGVIIPAANVRTLMLRSDVVAATEAGRFHVYAVETVDQAIELLSGLPAGEPGSDGTYPAGSFNARVRQRLDQLVELAQRFPVPESGAAGL